MELRVTDHPAEYGLIILPDNHTLTQCRIAGERLRENEVGEENLPILRAWSTTPTLALSSLRDARNDADADSVQHNHHAVESVMGVLELFLYEHCAHLGCYGWRRIFTWQDQLVNTPSFERKMRITHDDENIATALQALSTPPLCSCSPLA